MIANAPPIIRVQPPGAPPPSGQLLADAFWPPIDLTKMRDAVSIDSSVTQQRLEHATVDAMACVIDQLSQWAASHQAAGVVKLADVPGLSINGQSAQVNRFERSVYAYAKANLSERYAESNAKGRTERGDESRRAEADEYRRDGLFSVRDILGVPRMTSELI